LGSHTKRKVPARHASGFTLLAQDNHVGNSNSRVVYVSVKTIEPLPEPKKKLPTEVES
jgi:hypothetical protein